MNEGDYEYIQNISDTKDVHMLVALAFDAVMAWLIIGSIVTSNTGASAYNLSIVTMIFTAYLCIVVVGTDYLGIQKKLRLNRIRPGWLKAPAVTAVCALIFFIFYPLIHLFAWRFG